MKICLITNLYPPFVRGGAERVVAQLAVQRLAAGDEVMVITTVPWRQRGFSVEKGVRLWRLWHGNFYFNLFSGQNGGWLRLLNLIWTFFNWPLAQQIKKILLLEKPAVVWTHNLAGTSWLIPGVIRQLKLRHEHTVHDVQLAIPSGRLLVGEEKFWRNQGWLVRLYSWLQKRIWRSPALVSSPSRWLLDFYEQRGFFPQSEKVVKRNVVVAPPCPAAPPAGNLVILYAGQVEAAKGVVMLAEIFVELQKQKKNNLELWVAGAGSALDRLTELAAGCPRIKLLGLLERPALERVLCAAHLVVLPSLLYENSPTIVAEAVSAGRAVAVSGIGGAPELLENYPAGQIVAPNRVAWRDFLAKISQKDI